MSFRALRRSALSGISRLLWPLFGLLLRLLLKSWRIRLIDPAESIDGLADRDGAVILAFWHSDLLPCGAVLHRRASARGHSVTGLVSRSADGEILARAAAGFGFRTIRGSTSRGGLAALRHLYRELEGGGTIAIAPDGPRGPARVVKPGIVQVALLAGAPIVPMAAVARQTWRARSWDRTLFPKPFAQVVVLVGQEMRFERGADLGREAARLSATLDELGESIREAAHRPAGGASPN